jgi:hypothetical protein
MMILVTTAAILVGAMLGLRFKAFILLPASVIDAAVTLGVGIVYTDSLWSILLVAAATIAALQFGYFAATLIASVRRARGSSYTIVIAQREVR